MVSIDDAVNAILALIHRWNLPQFLYNWQTLIAGVLAVLAAWRTIRATTQSADREVKASQDQTAVARKEIETTVRLERQRLAREGYAFCAMLEAAMGRVLAEALEAKRIFSSVQDIDTVSSEVAYEARQCFTKSAFSELRGACLRQGSPMTTEFLELESDIDKFASRWRAPQNEVRKGLHADFQQQRADIELKSAHLREEAVAGMKRANAVIAETETPIPSTMPKRPWWRRLTG